MSKPIDELENRTRFEPAEVEPRIAERWLDSGLFHPEADGEAAENYSIAIPPPNITGSLHMGHALNGSIQDVLIRYNRMKSARLSRTKWILAPTTRGSRRRRRWRRRCTPKGQAASELGREAFVAARVGVARALWRHRIVEQFKRLGASCDYERRALHAR